MKRLFTKAGGLESARCRLCNLCITLFLGVVSYVLTGACVEIRRRYFTFVRGHNETT